jgi:hypothetical protein
MKGKHILIGIAALAVIAVIFISIDDTFPPEYARGTIGVADTVVSGVEAASRYRTEQINADDVQLGDTEVQKLLQNDAFVALVQDPKFAKAIEAFNDLEKALEDEVNNKAIEGPDGGSNETPMEGSTLRALEDQQIMEAIQNGESRSALWDDDVKRLIVSPLWSAMIKDQNVRDYIGSEAVKGGDTASDNEFEAEEDGDIASDHEFKAEEGDEVASDHEFKAEEGDEVASDHEFKAEEGGDIASGHEFKALEDGDIASDHEFKALEGGDTPADNNFESVEGGETNSDNNFESVEGGETNSDHNFEAVSDDVREVLESANFKKAVQDHPGFWRAVTEDPGFAKAIQDNYESLDSFSKIPEPAFAKAIEAIGEGLEVIQGSESVIGDLARQPAPVFGLVAQDPNFEALLGGVSESGGVAGGNDR